jgi:hypothetical protein
MTMKLSPGLPISRSLTRFGITKGESMLITLRSSALYSGTSYKLISISRSSIAQRHKRVLTACLGLLKTSDEPSAAKCEKTTEALNSLDFYQYPALMDRLTIRQS